MKRALSNIAWDAAQDAVMHEFMAATGFSGLEIAPTRLFVDNPYSRLRDAAAYARALEHDYGLAVCSMQSIWYGRTERIFGSDAERAALEDHTRRAVDFAAAIECPVLVLGAPKNRNIDSERQRPLAVDFFRAVASYAHSAGCTIAFEPNPALYGTNFINTTAQAAQLCREVASAGFRVNIDYGTVVANGETTEELARYLGCAAHVHISEPGLVPITRRAEHHVLRERLAQVNYQGYVSVEMKNTGNIADIQNAARYLCEVFA